MSDEIFILTSDTIQGYEGDIIRFPKPVFGIGFGETSMPAYTEASDDLSEKARKLGANAVIDVKYSDAQWTTHTDKKGYFVRVVGQAVLLNPPLMDPDEYIKNAKESEDLL